MRVSKTREVAMHLRWRLEEIMMNVKGRTLEQKIYNAYNQRRIDYTHYRMYHDIRKWTNVVGAHLTDAKGSIATANQYSDFLKYKRKL